jgi:hypothetical protein
MMGLDGRFGLGAKKYQDGWLSIENQAEYQWVV